MAASWISAVVYVTGRVEVEVERNLDWLQELIDIKGFKSVNLTLTDKVKRL